MPGDLRNDTNSRKRGEQHDPGNRDTRKGSYRGQSIGITSCNYVALNTLVRDIMLNLTTSSTYDVSENSSPNSPNDTPNTNSEGGSRGHVQYVHAENRRRYSNLFITALQGNMAY
jgi:hypothetical protein